MVKINQKKLGQYDELNEVKMEFEVVEIESLGHEFDAEGDADGYTDIGVLDESDLLVMVRVPVTYPDEIVRINEAKISFSIGYDHESDETFDYDATGLDAVDIVKQALVLDPDLFDCYNGHKGGF